MIRSPSTSNIEYQEKLIKPLNKIDFNTAPLKNSYNNHHLTQQHIMLDKIDRIENRLIILLLLITLVLLLIDPEGFITVGFSHANIRLIY